MKGFCRNDIICGIHLQRIKPKVSAAVCQWFFCGTTADMTPLTTWKKRKLVHGQRSVFRSEKCRHRVKPAIFCRGRFQFLDENSACFSHRCSGGHQHSFTLAELFCTKIWDKRKPLGCAADLDIHRPTDNLLTKTKFSSRGIGGGSAGWHLYTRLPSQFLDENRPCFRSGGQRGCGSELACGTCFASRLLLFSTPYPFVGFLNDRRLGR